MTLTWNDQNVGDQAVSGPYYDRPSTFTIPASYDGDRRPDVVAGDSTLAGGCDASATQRYVIAAARREPAWGTCTCRHRELGEDYPYSIVHYRIRQQWQSGPHEHGQQRRDLDPGVHRCDADFAAGEQPGAVGRPVTLSWNDQNVGDQAVNGPYYDRDRPITTSTRRSLR